MKRVLFTCLLVIVYTIPVWSQTTSVTKSATIINDWPAYVANWKVVGATQLSGNDNVYAYTRKLSKNGLLQLQLTGFQFSIPAGAFIDSVIVSARRFKTGKGTVSDHLVYVIRQDPVNTTSFQIYGPSFSDPNPFPDSEGEVLYKQAGGGSNGTLPGGVNYQWTPEMINHSKFGVRLFSLEPVGGPAVVYYDQVTIRVRYTETAARQEELTNNVQKALSPAVYPNPFTASAKLQFSAVENGKAEVEIYNLAGARVSVLFSADVVKGELYTVPVGEGLVSKGVYIYRVNNGTQSFTGRITKLE